jgi:hypothetical protein
MHPTQKRHRIRYGSARYTEDIYANLGHSSTARLHLHLAPLSNPLGNVSPSLTGAQRLRTRNLKFLVDAKTSAAHGRESPTGNGTPKKQQKVFFFWIFFAAMSIDVFWLYDNVIYANDMCEWERCVGPARALFLDALV